MRIRRIKVHNYGGVTEAEVTFPDTGITIIEGVNEAGKTSLIEAVDAILSIADSSSSRRIKAVVPVGKDVGPEVEVDITAGAFEFTYRKRWVRSPETVLDVSRPKREQLSGREAHDRVRQILDEAVDLDLWQALRLHQGTALSQASFEVSALGRALDAAAGGDVAGDREDVLWDRIEVAYGEYWTPGGKPKNALRAVEEALDAALEKADRANAYLRELDNDADEIQRLEIAVTALQQVHAETAREVERLTEQNAAIEKIRQAVNQAEQELQRADAIYQKVHGDRQRRDERVEAVRIATEELERVTGDIEESAPAREIVLNKRESAREALKDARSASEDAQRTHEQARSDSEFRRQQIEIEQLTERRDRVDEAQQRLALADEALESINIDDDLLGEIDEAHLELAKAKVAAERALATVAVSALQKVRLSIDGSDLEMDPGDEHSLTVRDTTRIVVPDVVAVSIVAGVDNADVIEKLEAARTRYEDLCRRGSVPDFAAARVQADTRAAALRDRTDALATIERDLRDLTFAALSKKIDRLIGRTTEYRQNRGSEPPIPDDLTAAQDLERAAQQASAETKAVLDRANALAQETAEDLNQLDVQGAGLNARREIAESRLASAKKTLTAARDEQDDEQLVAASAAATSAAEAAQANVTSVEAQLAQADPDSLEVLLANAKAALSRSVQDLQENEGRRTKLQIKLTLETERGPAHDADEAETNLVEARTRFERLNSQADAAQLLHETFLQHRQEARQRYNQPFRDRIERLGRIVYGPTFEVHLGDDLSVENRTLDNTILDFDQLSTGAQEQLGLLARLACATLVAPEGGAPVIFDDALGWTDPGRLDRMGAAISTTADDCQVIILTCVPDRYSAVGKARTVTIQA